MAVLKGFQVTNFRNIHDSGWVTTTQVTALIGQNESGKSNLCEALFKLNPFDDSKYDLNFDWPVDLWEKKDPKAIVCSAQFELSEAEERALLQAVQPPAAKQEPAKEGEEAVAVKQPIPIKRKDDKLPITLTMRRNYDGEFFTIYENISADIDLKLAWKAISNLIPKFVYIFEYDVSGQQVELPQLAQRLREVGYAKLTPEQQTIKIILDLAKVNIDDFLQKGENAEGRTLRSFDKRQASAYLTRKFQELWKQKKVDFDIEIDGPTLNIFVKDVGFSMPVRLDRRSTGFRWYVSFAWRFTHATSGEFKNVILLLEEPGVHLHPAGQRDLIQFFDELGKKNQVIYTTHLPAMIDTGAPERVRIVETKDHHTTVAEGIVSTSRQPMMVIEAALGLSPSLSDLLGHRVTLIVEGTDDFVMINKLAGVFAKSGEIGLPEDIYLWPAQGAGKTPMYAGFLIGHRWPGAVLLDSDKAGTDAAKKIKELYGVPEGFPTLLLGPAIGKKDAAIGIEDLLPRDVYLDVVNSAYKIQITQADLKDVDLRPISVSVEDVLISRGFSGLSKSRVLGELLKLFDKWKEVKDLPKETKENAAILFKKIRVALGREPQAKPASKS